MSVVMELGLGLLFVGLAACADTYSLRGVYFSPEQFSSTADCLTAASAHGLPLDLCR